MRNITLVSTKDHFLFIITCEFEQEELWIGEVESCIGFSPTGSMNSFFGNDTIGWTPWTANSIVDSPFLHSSPINTNLGGVASSNNTTCFTVMAKENAFAGVMEEQTTTLANTTEREMVEQDSESVFVIMEQCHFTSLRDVDTFALIPDPVNPITVDDVEII